MEKKKINHRSTQKYDELPKAPEINILVFSCNKITADK